MLDDDIDPSQQLELMAGLPTVFVMPSLATAHTEETLRRGFGVVTRPVQASDLLWELQVAHEKWRASEALRNRPALNRATLRAVRDAVITVDDNELVLFVNEAAEAMTGLSLQEAVGQHRADVVPLFDGVDHGGVVELSSIEDDSTRVYALHGAGGARRDVRVSVARVVDPTEGALRVLVIRDVTEERRLQNQVIMMDRLASIGTMTAGVAHELNNPLSFVVSNVDFAIEQLRAQPDLGDRLADVIAALEDAQFGGQRVASVVQNMRVLSRADDGSGRSVMCLAPAVDSAIRLSRHLMATGAEMRSTIDSGLRVIGSEGGLVQVFVNLLANAAHATAAQGDAARIEVLAEQRDTDVTVLVRDNGTGMPPEVAERIFDPFFTTKDSGQGTGLGLSIVHTLLTRMGAQIAVESAVGRGTTFVVRLRRPV
jgi:PAS domain S-box-containing protein